MIRMKRCRNCGRLKLHRRFHRNTGRADGRQPWCKECMAKYYMRNRDRLLPKHNEAAWRSYFKRVGIPTGEKKKGEGSSES